jgi:hypothetical protein
VRLHAYLELARQEAPEGKGRFGTRTFVNRHGLSSGSIHRSYIPYQGSQLDLQARRSYLAVIRTHNLQEPHMTTATAKSLYFPAEQTQKAPSTLAAIIAALFLVRLRDSQSDAIENFGL